MTQNLFQGLGESLGEIEPWGAVHLPGTMSLGGRRVTDTQTLRAGGPSLMWQSLPPSSLSYKLHAGERCDVRMRLQALERQRMLAPLHAV